MLLPLGQSRFLKKDGSKRYPILTNDFGSCKTIFILLEEIMAF